jgi:hypothetical protein
MITKLPPIATLYGPQAKVVQPGGKSLPVVPTLDAGKILSATVMESRGQNMFTLKTADLQFTVQSNLPLVKGEQIQFQVLNTTPVLELQKVDPGLPSEIRQNLTLAGETINVKPLVQNLQSTFFAASKSLMAATQGASHNTAPQATATPPQTAQPTLQKMDAGAMEQLIRQGNYTVKATILENQGKNRNLVRISGESYPLQGRMTAETGESKTLQLQSLQPTINFFPVGNEGVVNRSQPLVLNAQDQSLPALVRALQLPLFTGLDLLQPTQQQLLQNLQNLQPTQLQEPGAGELLKRSLEQLGLRSEALVAQGKGQDAATQLKSVLAEIVRIFQGQEEISSTASRILSTLENSQFVQANLQQENNLLFPLPFSFLEKGYLMVEQEGGQQGGEGDAEESLACTLHLTLAGLGNVRVRCVQGKDSIRIAFFLDSPEKAEFVSTFENELQENISSAPLLSLSFASGADSPGTALLQKILPPEQSIFNTSA